MPRKPPSGDQPTLFPLDLGDSHGPANVVISPVKGDDNAVQDDSSRTAATTDGVARAAAADTQAPAGHRDLRQRIEGQPRTLEGNVRPDETRQPPESDRQRSNGDGSQGTGGSFTDRIARSRGAFPRRGDGLRPQTHVARLKASQPTLFDSLSDDRTSTVPAPPGALSDGTLISPPGRASGNPVPPEGLPQFSAGTVATRAEPRPGADSSASRQAPSAGPETQPEGNRAMKGTQLSLQLDTPPPPFRFHSKPELITP